jgi:hypothetical protein
MRRVFRIAPLFAALLAGCSGKSGEKPIEVTGTAELDGTPLQVGTVLLAYPDGSTATGPLTPDGKFRIPEAKPGPARAAVKTSMFAFQFSPNAPKVGRPDGVYVAVPRKYEDPATADLPVEVKAGEPVRLVLTGGKK